MSTEAQIPSVAPDSLPPSDISLILYYFGPEGLAWIGAAQIEKIEKLTSQPAFGAIVGSLGTVLLREFRRLLPDVSPKEPPDGP